MVDWHKSYHSFKYCRVPLLDVNPTLKLLFRLTKVMHFLFCDYHLKDALTWLKLQEINKSKPNVGKSASERVPTDMGQAMETVTGAGRL